MNNKSSFLPLKTFSSNTTYKILLISSILGFTINVLGVFCLTFIKDNILIFYNLDNLPNEQKLNLISSLFNYQFLGIVFGCIYWGYLSDRIGRLKVLIYSGIIMVVGNLMSTTIAPSFDIFNMYRFITGFGLAGEVLVMVFITESLSNEKRASALSYITGCSMFSPVIYIALFKVFPEVDWRIWLSSFSFLGLIVIILRLFLSESEIFLKNKNSPKSEKKQINVLNFFFNKDRLKRFILAFLVGMPILSTITTLITDSKIFAQAFDHIEDLDSKMTMLFFFAGYGIINFNNYKVVSYFKSYKKTFRLYLIFSIIFISIYISPLNSSEISFYILCFLIGLSGGYYGLVLNVSAMQFGTNIRGTAGSVFLNFLRGSIIIWSSLFGFLFHDSYFNLSIKTSLIITFTTLFILAIIGLYKMKELYGKNIDFNE